MAERPQVLRAVRRAAPAALVLALAGAGLGLALGGRGGAAPPARGEHLAAGPPAITAAAAHQAAPVAPATAVATPAADARTDAVATAARFGPAAPRRGPERIRGPPATVAA